MFITSPDAEQYTPRGLVKNGERVWRYFEFQLQIPYFLVAVRSWEDESEFTRYFMLSQLDDVLSLASQQDAQLEISYIKLLSPGYMNRSEGYEMGLVKEIWRDKNVPVNKIFVMSDGGKLKFELMEQDDNDQKMELVLAL